MLKLPPIKAVVFDMDGLLFDTETLFFDAMQTVGAELGHQITHAFYLTLIGLPIERGHLLMREEFGAAFATETFHEACRRRFFALLDTDLRLKPGVPELLDHLETCNLPKAISTSSQRTNVDHHLAAFDLTHRFDAIIAHGDYAHGKPHPAPYLAAARALGIEPSACLALEDSYNGVRSAVAAGMVTIMVPDMLPDDPEMRALGHRVVVDLHCVRTMLGG